ncbi:MAG: Rne/Rng family ribonuclease [Ignavibacteria bacterium]|nr:Rne/Rng family ribonuclease [Ignavibacteria bacterium]
MKKEIIINAALNEVRIAITENGDLAELFIEIPDKERLVGNIYMGRVGKVIQGMNAAFIDIGIGQDGFLHFSDVDSSLEDSFITEEEDDDEDDDEPFLPPIPDAKLTDSAAMALRKSPAKTKKSAKPLPTFSTKRSGVVSIGLQPKQNIIVQVVREAYSSKGVRVSTKVSMAGRYVVLMPFESAIGVSRKIQSIKERKRLRRLAKSILPEGFGCIIRTAAEEKSETELRRDWEHLLDIWKEVEANVKKSNNHPALLYQDKNLTGSVIRDLFTNDVVRVAVDSKKLYNEVTNYLNWASPDLDSKVEMYKGKKPIFDAYRLEKAISDTYARKINLPSGGSIVLDQTEAMFVVDVNSGRASSDHEQERNSLKTNLEAAYAIAQQLRLRDAAGIILIDFIDMAFEENRKKVFNEMRREMNRDRAKSTVYPLTALNLMQMTRQRVRQNITERLSDNCPTCAGTGRVQSRSVVLNAIERWLHSFRMGSREFSLLLLVHPTMAEFLLEGSISRISRLMIKHFIKVKLQQSDVLRPNEFKFYSTRQQRDITQDFS